MLKNIGCSQKWNAVKKAYAEFLGTSYKITPINKTIKNKSNNNNPLYRSSSYNPYNRSYSNPYTRRYNPYNRSYGGKNSKIKNKTKK